MKQINLSLTLVHIKQKLANKTYPQVYRMIHLILIIYVTYILSMMKYVEMNHFVLSR